MTTQVQHQVISQGYLSKPIKESIAISNFCKEYVRYILEISSSSSSKHGPSHLNYTSPSSRNTYLPQVSLNSVSLNPYVSSKKINRISSNTFKTLFPMAGCMNLLNYYWRYNVTFRKEESLLGVQIFMIHLLGTFDVQLNLNLNILLHSTQDDALLRPIIIVLSSFLPRRFYLSVLSYLGRTQQPIHILMTNANSDIIFADRGLRDSDIDRIFISVLDKSYSEALAFSKTDDYVVLEKDIEQISAKIMYTDIFKNGNFKGFRYNHISSNKNAQLLWFFDNGRQYSQRKPLVKLVAIDVIEKNTDDINLVLGKEEGPRMSQDDVFYTEHCEIVKQENYHVLADRISNLVKTYFSLDESRTCSYSIMPSSKLLTVETMYKSVSWLHFEEISNISLQLSSERITEHNETYLLIITTKNIGKSKINVDSFFLHKKVHILTNISLDHFYEESGRNSLLISFQQMNTNVASKFAQSNSAANYISRSSYAVMQTTVYKLLSSKTYEILVNIDDSYIHLIEDVVVNPICSCKKKANVSLSLDLKLWKLINQWIPTEFMLGNQNIHFKRLNDSFATLKNPLSKCSENPELLKNKIYGIWHGYKYILQLPFTFRCMVQNKEVKSNAVMKVSTTESMKEHFIMKNDNVFNDSKFTHILRVPLHNRGRLYIQIMQSIVNDVSWHKGVQLRDCYLTNQMASEDDLNSATESSKNFKKINIIKNGCINQTSFLYSDIDENMRPYNYSELKGIIYRFSVGVNGDRWASLLSRSQIWMEKGQLEVHLYCGVNRCSISERSAKRNAADCKPEKACFEVFISKQIFQYFGMLTIIQIKFEFRMIFKICILIFLNILIVFLLFCLILFARRLYKFRLKYKCSPSASIRADHWRKTPPEVAIKTTKKSKSKLDYHSLKLLSGTHQSSAKLYSSPSCSLQQLIVDNDRSFVLRAGYLSSPSDKSTPFPFNFQGVSIEPACNPRLLSHSISELCLSHNVPVVLDKALYSWPLSLADRHRRSHNSQPPPPRHQSFRSSTKRDCYRLTLSSKLKVSVTFTSGGKSFSYSSNPKLSSNRTTVSGGESASAVSDMPNNKHHKWWSPLSNCSANNAVIISRN